MGIARGRDYTLSSSEMDESEDMDDVREDVRRWRGACRLLDGAARAQREGAGEVE